MSIRSEKKRQTRSALMNAALELVGQGQNFASISLREVAKTAGVVPTSFYRHFQDMEELGLSLVDELGLTLRKLMRASRKPGETLEKQIRKSVEAYILYVAQHPNLFLFMSQCRTGGTPRLRSAIRNELRFFVQELVTDISQANLLPDVDSTDLDMIAELVVLTMAETTIEVLDLPTGNRLLRTELIERRIKQLSLIFLGASQWKSGES